MAKMGHVKLNQKNIFGFVHCSSEVLQQFDIVSGFRRVPERLRPFVNIPPLWKVPSTKPNEYFHELFCETNIFIVEISSIRQIRFKEFFLQINRTRELLASTPQIVRSWWEPLARNGINKFSLLDLDNLSVIEREVVTQLQAAEQTAADIERDIRRICKFLGKKVLFVPHFDINYQGKSIPQRQLIVQVMNQLIRTQDLNVFNPKPLIETLGFSNVIQDLAHYKPEFESSLAIAMSERIDHLATA